MLERGVCVSWPTSRPPFHESHAILHQRPCRALRVPRDPARHRQSATFDQTGRQSLAQRQHRRMQRYLVLRVLFDGGNAERVCSAVGLFVCVRTRERETGQTLATRCLTTVTIYLHEVSMAVSSTTNRMMVLSSNALREALSQSTAALKRKMCDRPYAEHKTFCFGFFFSFFLTSEERQKR
jgi:hypothetical protein